MRNSISSCVLIACIFFCSCLQRPNENAENTQTPTETTFSADETLLEVISFSALKQKIMRVFSLTEASSTIATLNSFQSDFEDSNFFTSGKYFILLQVFDEACTESDLNSIGLSDPADASEYWNALTGLMLSEDQQSALNEALADPGIKNSVQEKEMACLSLALQAPAWIKR